VLEIGTNNGGTAALWCEIADHVTSVDLPNGPYGSCNWGDSVARNGILSKRYVQFRGILGDSHAPSMLEAVGAAKLDLLFIDADHTYGGVKQDFEMYSGLVKSGGIVLFHDIVETGLTASMQVGAGRFWRELTTRYETKEFSINADWGGLGALVIP
jgi:predicted O-methyltransferase YrrM